MERLIVEDHPAQIEELKTRWRSTEGWDDVRGTVFSELCLRGINVLNLHLGPSNNLSRRQLPRKQHQQRAVLWLNPRYHPGQALKLVALAAAESDGAFL